MKKFEDLSYNEKYDMLEEAGWTIECESPFEIRHKDGSFASMQAARMCVDPIIENYLIEKEEEEKETLKKFILRANEERLQLILSQGDFEKQIEFCNNPADYGLLKRHYSKNQEYERAAQSRYYEKESLKYLLSKQ